MGTLKNPRWEKFAQLVAEGQSQRQAYLAAYPRSKAWKPETVDSKASVLLNQNGKVLARYKELQAQSADQSIMTAKERKLELSRYVRDKKLSPTDHMKAIDLLNKMEGDYTDNVNLTGKVDTGRPLEKVSDDELRRTAELLAGDDAT